MTFIGNQVQFLPFHSKLLAQVRVYGDSPLPVHFDIGPQIGGVEGDILRGFGIVLKGVKELFICPPFGDRVYLAYAAIKARQIQFALRQAVEKLCKSGWEFEPSFIVETPGISATGQLDGGSIRNWVVVRHHFLSTLVHLLHTTDCGTTQVELQ